jgi:hypothetical protein
MQFHSYPEYINIQDYQKNIEAYSAHLKNIDEVLGLFSMGNIRVPGLSDIDLIVVVKNLVSHTGTLSPFDLNLDRRLFVHEVFVLNLNLTNHFNYIFYPTNIKPIFVKSGIRITFPPLHSISKELKIIYLIELGKMRLEQLCAISRSQQCNVRKLITRVSSIIHSLNIADELSIKVPDDVHTYKDRILHLRDNWTKNQGASIQHIDKIFEDGLKSWCSILEAASDRLGQISGIVRNEKPINRKLMNIHFSDKNCCNLVKDRRGCCQQVLLPKNLYYHYEGYKRPGIGKYRHEQKKRLSLIRAHRQFLNKAGLIFSMSGNPGFPVNRKEKVNLLIKGLKNFISSSTRSRIRKRI